MKKWIMAIVCLMTMVAFTSCSTKYMVTANYDVCYPDGTKTFNESIKVEANKDCPNIDVLSHSIGGTNYISIRFDGKFTKNNVNHFISTTAPTRLNYYNVERVNKKKNTAYTKSKGDDIYMSDILSH